MAGKDGEIWTAKGDALRRHDDYIPGPMVADYLNELERNFHSLRKEHNQLLEQNAQTKSANEPLLSAAKCVVEADNISSWAYAINILRSEIESAAQENTNSALDEATRIAQENGEYE